LHVLAARGDARRRRALLGRGPSPGWPLGRGPHAAALRWFAMAHGVVASSHAVLAPPTLGAAPVPRALCQTADRGRRRAVESRRGTDPSWCAARASRARMGTEPQKNRRQALKSASARVLLCFCSRTALAIEPRAVA